jgi:hypothetical protein
MSASATCYPSSERSETSRTAKAACQPSKDSRFLFSGREQPNHRVNPSPDGGFALDWRPVPATATKFDGPEGVR